MFESIEDLRAAGFEGFRSMRDLSHSRLVEVPQTTGVYVVARPDNWSPFYLASSPPGRFKGRDPTIPTRAVLSMKPPKWNEERR